MNGENGDRISWWLRLISDDAKNNWMKSIVRSVNTSLCCSFLLLFWVVRWSRVDESTLTTCDNAFPANQQVQQLGLFLLKKGIHHIVIFEWNNKSHNSSTLSFFFLPFLLILRFFPFTYVNHVAYSSLELLWLKNNVIM